MIVIKNSKIRNILRFIIPLAVIPVVAIFGSVLFGEKRHLLVSLLVAMLSLVLFLVGFERKNIGSRKMVLVAVMTALSIIGRMIPIFKPVTAITILCAIYMGPESGFLVGASSALLSNFMFGQGPWTPFQMLGWGLIGYIAGLLSKPLARSKILLIIYGLVSGVLFSLVMDVWTVLWYQGGFDIDLYLAAIVTALPHTILYIISNCAFLWIMARPFGEKLGRIKIKYGL